VTSRDEREALARFSERYAIAGSGIGAEIERRVIGGVWGANGYTTVEQADELARRLQLGPGDLLVDVGTGRGWPAVYLAAATGCTVVGTDMPLDPLRRAARRARAEGVDGAMVAASARHLPFRTRSFDAAVHTDVLC